MQRLISALSLTVIAFGGSLAAQDGELFRIPVGSIDRYVVSTFSEQVESFQMDRLRLKGRKDILYEIIPDMRWVRDAVGASVVFENRWKPSLRYEVTSFPENRLDREFGPSLLKTYLNTRRLELAEAGIEILTPPEKITSGPAQFRILGRRAIFFSYAFTRGEETIIRGENWVSIEDTVHIVAIEAPEDTFSRFFERIRVAMNSMQLMDDSAATASDIQ